MKLASLIEGGYSSSRSHQSPNKGAAEMKVLKMMRLSVFGFAGAILLADHGPTAFEGAVRLPQYCKLCR